MRNILHPDLDPIGSAREELTATLDGRTVVLLVVEEDPQIAASFQAVLQEVGFAVECRAAAGHGYLSLARCVRTLGVAHRLSRREEEVVGLVLRGLASTEIASHLGIGLGTVKTHLQRIWDKTGARSRQQLVGLLFSAE
jgi:DNA-binding CsgD family transcriptional regulator